MTTKPKRNQRLNGKSRTAPRTKAEAEAARGDRIERGREVVVEFENRYLVPTGGAAQKVPVEKLCHFLLLLSEYGNASQACREAGLVIQTLYRYKNTNDEFRAAWEEAAQIGAENLEDEARRRAFKGWLEPVVYRGEIAMTEEVIDENGEVVEPSVPVTVRKYSDTLLIFLLKGLKPEKYRERSQTEVTGPGGGAVEHKITVEFIDPPDAGS